MQAAGGEVQTCAREARGRLLRVKHSQWLGRVDHRDQLPYLRRSPRTHTRQPLVLDFKTWPRVTHPSGLWRCRGRLRSGWNRQGHPSRLSWLEQRRAQLMNAGCRRSLDLLRGGQGRYFHALPYGQSRGGVLPLLGNAPATPAPDEPGVVEAEQASRAWRPVRAALEGSGAASSIEMESGPEQGPAR